MQLIFLARNCKNPLCGRFSHIKTFKDTAKPVKFAVRENVHAFYFHLYSTART